MTRATWHILVSGRVQGVGYRAFVLCKAQERGIVGWVRNLFDGRVEALAQGAPDQLSHLRVELVAGPKHAEVLTVEVKDIAKAPELRDFLVEANGETPWSGF